MSWIEKIENDFVITCGDGRKFFPNWMNASRSVEYNSTEFNFPGVAGTLVDRREPKGTKYNLTFYFQGEDNLDISEAFRISAADKRFWKISHPLYGLINVQPSSLQWDDTEYNVTKITGVVTETITDTNPKPVLIPEDKIEEDVEFANESISENFENDVSPKSSDLNQAKADNERAFAKVDAKIEDENDALEYFNTFNEAEAALNGGLSDAGSAIRKTQTFILAPALFNQSVKSRVDMLVINFEDLRKNIQIPSVSLNEKRFFEAQAAATLSAMSLASAIIFDDDDYKNRPQVNEVVEVLLRSFARFLGDLDSLQTGTGGNPSDYIPTAQTIIDINNLLNYTMSNLFAIGLEAKQERFYSTPDDTDLISLTHKLYGLVDGDESINELIRNNDFGLKQMLEIKKDTLVKYYI